MQILGIYNTIIVARNKRIYDFLRDLKKKIKFFTSIRESKKKKQNKGIVYRVIKIKEDPGTYIIKLFKIRHYFLKQIIISSFGVTRIKATFTTFFFIC